MRPTAPLAHAVVVVLTVGLVVGAAGAVGTAGADVDGIAPGPAAGMAPAAEPTPGEADNVTRHEDPRAVDADGDLGAARDWLAGRMAVRLEDCVVGVGSGGTDVCAFEDDYPDWLARYVDVADDTRETTDDGLGGTFESAASDAGTYAEAVSSFRETHRAYRDARAAGDERRARSLARELQRDGAAVLGAGDVLGGRLRALEAGAAVDLSDARDSLNATRADVRATVDEVEREQFVATVLTADLAPRTVSFLEPGTVSGRLTTANGTPLADRTVRLAVGDRRVETRTDGTGSFALRYRPTTLPLSTDELTVRYVPRDASPYLASEAAVPVTVEPVAPTVTVRARPDAVGFGDALTVTGRVAAGGVGAPDVPVVVTLDGRRLGLVRTDASGEFSLAATVAAGDATGPREVRARLPLEGRALAAAAGSASVTVAPTATTLSLAAAADGPSTVSVEGALGTAGGRAVPGQPVAVRIDGTAVGTLRTRADGGFRGTVTVPPSLREAAATDVRVAVAYDGRGTNLAGSNASATVTLPAAGAGPAERGPGGGLARPVDALPGDPPHWALLALAGLLALLAAAYRRWGPGLLPVGGGRPDATAGSAADDAGGPSPSDGATEPAVAPLDAARERLAADPDGAVRLAYAAVRGALTGDGRQGRSRADTHWEFLAACREDGLDTAAVDGLTRLTEAYERAAYAPAAVSPDAASAALEAADGLV